jgi:hypothetical protein
MQLMLSMAKVPDHYRQGVLPSDQPFSWWPASLQLRCIPMQIGYVIANITQQLQRTLSSM